MSSLPKKKSRTVLVDSKKYRYLIKPMRKVSYPDDKEITLIVQEDCKNPGAPLLLTLDKLSILGGKNHGVGPGDVRKIIQKATDTGWDPARKGAGYMPKDIIEITREGYTPNHCPCMMTPCPHEPHYPSSED